MASQDSNMIFFIFLFNLFKINCFVGENLNTAIINYHFGIKLLGGFKFEAQRALKIDETPLRVF